MFTPDGSNMQLGVEIAADTSGFDRNVGGAMDSLLSFKGAIAATGAAVTALATGALVKAAGAAAQFEEAMVGVNKVTSPETAAALRGEIMKMSEELPLAQKELAGIAEDAGRLGIEGVDNIKEFTRVTSEMAVSTDLASDEAANAFARITQLTGTPISNVRELGAAVNELSNTMATTSSEITDSVLRGGAVMSNAGLQTEQILAVSAALNEVSESSQRAGTRLRRLFQEMNNPKKVREISVALTEAGFESDALNQKTRDLQQAFISEQQELTKLQGKLRETSAELKGLQDTHDNLSDKMRENRIKIQEIRADARDENRELTEEEKAQIEELQHANKDLRLEQMKNADEMDEVKEKRDEQKESIEEQRKEVEKSKDALAEQFQKFKKENPVKFLKLMASAMNENGEAAEELNSSLSTVSRQALAGLGKNLEGLEEALETSNEQFAEATSLSEEFTKANSTFNAHIKRTKNRLRNIGITIGETLLPKLNKLLDGINDGLEVFSRFNRKTDGTAGALALIGTAIGGAVASGAALVSMFGGAATTSGALSGALTALTGPLGVVIAAVAALGTAYATNFAGFRDVVDSVFGRINRTLRQNEGNLEDLERVIRTVISDAQAIMQGLMQTAKFVFKNFLNPLLKEVASKFQKHFGSIVVEVTETITAIRGYIKPFVNWFKGFWAEWGDEITHVAKIAMDAIVGTIGYAIDLIATWLKVGMNIIQGDWGEAWDVIKSFATDTMDGIVAFIEKWDLAAKLKGAVLAAVEAFWNALKGLGKDTMNFFKSLGSDVGNAFGDALNNALGLPATINLPSAKIEGKKIGGGSLTVPKFDFGGAGGGGGSSGVSSAAGNNAATGGSRNSAAQKALSEIQKKQEKEVKAEVKIDAPADSRMAKWMRENARVEVEKKETDKSRLLDRQNPSG